MRPLVRSACRQLGFAGYLEGEFENFATARVPRRNPADQDELHQPFGELPDGQPDAHRVAQMVAGAAYIAGLDIEKNENEFFRPDREIPWGDA
jgi:hypothetical protein